MIKLQPVIPVVLSLNASICRSQCVHPCWICDNLIWYNCFHFVRLVYENPSLSRNYSNSNLLYWFHSNFVPILSIVQRKFLIHVQIFCLLFGREGWIDFNSLTDFFKFFISRGELVQKPICCKDYEEKNGMCVGTLYVHNILS